MKDTVEFLILDTIKKRASIMPLFSVGYSYSKVMEWVMELENKGLIEYNIDNQRKLSVIGEQKWQFYKKEKKNFVILPMEEYRRNRINIDEIYLP